MLPLLNKENETFIPEENISCLNSEVYFSDEKYKCGLKFVFIHTGSKSECLKKLLSSKLYNFGKFSKCCVL